MISPSIQSDWHDTDWDDNDGHGNRSLSRWRAGAARRALLVALSSVFACAYPAAMPPPAAPFQAYRAGAPDVLNVTILPEPLIHEQVVVRPDGMITIQLLGDVMASGRTLNEIATDIEERISRFKRGARATVALAEAQSSAVTVLGEVRAPGTFSLVKETRIAEALGNRGGTTSFARERKIRVVRTQGGTPTLLMVDLRAIQGGDMSTNIQVVGGDVIYVPPTAWARFGYAMNSLLFPFQPFLGIFNAAAGSALRAAW
ncbi:MAG: polysaccharide export protein [Myxococcales bacterium]|nr:polysaccharide export protein [Myxococcales bacterium]